MGGGQIRFWLPFAVFLTCIIAPDWYWFRVGIAWGGIFKTCYDRCGCSGVSVIHNCKITFAMGIKVLDDQWDEEHVECELMGVPTLTNWIMAQFDIMLNVSIC